MIPINVPDSCQRSLIQTASASINEMWADGRLLPSEYESYLKAFNDNADKIIRAKGDIAFPAKEDSYVTFWGYTLSPNF